MIRVLFAAADGRWEDYEPHLRAAFAAHDLDVDLSRTHPPEIVDYIIYTPASGLVDFTPFIRCKAVLSLWAGVETIAPNPTLTQPLARMVDPGMTQGMVEYVTGHVLRHHLGMDAILRAQNGAWIPVIPPLAQSRRVTVLGLGALGKACAHALQQFGFDVAGWSASSILAHGKLTSRTTQTLTDMLVRSDILVLLLPLTVETTHILNAETLAQMPEGAIVINPGRGPLIDDAALIAALDRGTLAHATLDVFATEPLPEDHPFWRHDSVTVTPHIASATRPETASHVLASNIRRSEDNQPLHYLVDRSKGY